MRLSTAKRRYRGQWLAFVIQQQRNGDPEGSVIAHARSRRGLHLKLKKYTIPDVYLTFAGPPVKPGYIAVFLTL